ncbi:MAG: EamA family transporter [Betaproteobacteria bacterium]|nr:EamA family transporter [Betaproteobacteria bacterium]
MSYFYIFLTVILTVYGQIAIKWQVLKAGALPEALPDKIAFLFNLLLNPWVISAFAAALLASVFWMAAMTRLQLSHAYPFMSLAFVLILIASGVFFHEPITPLKVIGISLVILGLIVGSQG